MEIVRVAGDKSVRCQIGPIKLKKTVQNLNTVPIRFKRLASNIISGRDFQYWTAGEHYQDHYPQNILQRLCAISQTVPVQEIKVNQREQH